MSKFPTKPITCLGCPAYEWGLGFVPPTGKANSPIALVGQGPGEQEAKASRPFFPNAPSGSMLDRWLNKAGKSRTQMIVANVVQCWMPKTKGKSGPTGSRSPTNEEINYCWDRHVGPMLHESKAKFIVPIGAPATKFFLGLPEAGVEKYIGTFTKLDLPEVRHVRESITGLEELFEISRGESGESRAAHTRPDAALQHSSQLTKADKHRPDRDDPRRGETRESPSVPNAQLQPIELSEMQEEIAGSEGHEEMSLLQRSINSSDPRWVMPLMHPAAIVRGRWELSPVQEAYTKRVLEYAFKGTEPELQDPTKKPPHCKLYPTLGDVDIFKDEILRKGAYSLDIEEAGEHIICVGMTAIDLETNQLGTTICLRFRVQGGGLYWERWEDHVDAVRLLQEILLLPVPKIFQNGITFDVPELQALGFEIVGPFIDTMHLAHTAYCELPKSLQFLSTLYLGAPVWKTLVDTEELEGKG